MAHDDTAEVRATSTATMTDQNAADLWKATGDSSEPADAQTRLNREGMVVSIVEELEQARLLRPVEGKGARPSDPFIMVGGKSVHKQRLARIVTVAMGSALSRDRLLRVRGDISYGPRAPRPPPVGALVAVTRGCLCVLAFTDHKGNPFWKIGRVLSIYLDNDRQISRFWMKREDCKVDASVVILFADAKNTKYGNYILQPALAHVFYSLRTQLICTLNEQGILTSGRTLKKATKGRYSAPAGAPKDPDEPYIHLNLALRKEIDALHAIHRVAPAADDPSFIPAWQQLNDPKCQI